MYNRYVYLPVRVVGGGVDAKEKKEKKEKRANLRIASILICIYVFT